MEQSEIINDQITERFAQLFALGTSFELLFLFIILSIGLFFFLKKKRKLLVLIGIIAIILAIDIVHTGISVWTASKLMINTNDLNIANYPSIYRDTSLREENYSIDTIHSYYLNLYGIGPKDYTSLIRKISFFGKFTNTYLITFRVVRTPVLLRQYYYIKQKQYPFYIKYSETDLVMVTFKDKHLEFKVYTNNDISSDEYLQTTSFLKKWVNNIDIVDISVVIEKYSKGPVVNAQAGTLLNDGNILLDLTLSTLVRLGEM